ncbi:ubiquitin-conjugating enzyme E2, putative [Entamoeba invadens IP1]|uniref:Ubiquitin-conjugating enzyme E2, putative n=1 Tax=Entamoeba invadens IP1 TaxID=370355 RepID=A0A0A1UF68_ENTIV|nr:ubiquitin-conjugating enzyme E2, putative [Entamoeba invadens IP1]ELP92598.1 ubiquitin-conjugating enzyme E2, putative [Entamoeba invadens IP1]|eukprot:XP_004259369.1 ubiquitin-conjugating enzyme E2, putative [Entamoeba invadens IP1]
MNNFYNRLVLDFKKIRQTPLDGIDACPDEDDIKKWVCVIFGPEDTIWENGIFQLRMEFTEEYPVKPPKIVFVSPMFHPNIYTNGSICLDVLKSNWSAVFDVSFILLAIQTLLNQPNPDSPANTEAAELYKNNRSEYERRVKEVVQMSIKAIDE